MIAICKKDLHSRYVVVWLDHPVAAVVKKISDGEPWNAAVRFGHDDQSFACGIGRRRGIESCPAAERFSETLFAVGAFRFNAFAQPRIDDDATTKDAECVV